MLVVRGSPDTWFRRLQVGLLALGPAACVSHEAAARLHGLDGPSEDAVDYTYGAVTRRRDYVARTLRERLAARQLVLVT